MWGSLGGVRQGKGHPLRNHPRGPAPWGPTRGGVGDTGWGGAARVGLHGHNGLGEGLRHHGGGSWGLLLLQSSLLLLFGPVVLNQLGMVLLLLPDLNTETRQGRVSSCCISNLLYLNNNNNNKLLSSEL